MTAFFILEELLLHGLLDHFCLKFARFNIMERPGGLLWLGGAAPLT